MTWVFEESKATLGARLVLLALADYAHDDGTKAWPSVENIARKARLSERGARDALRKLEKDGHVVNVGKTKYGTSIYTIVCPLNPGAAVSAGAESAGGQNGAPLVLQTAPNPLEDPLGPSSSFSNGWLPRTVGGKRVTQADREQVDSLLDLFNELSGKRFSGKSWRESVLRRMFEHPDLGLTEHQALVRFQFEHPWWKGDPTPSVIWGNDRVFDRALNRTGAAEAEKPDFSMYRMKDRLPEIMAELEAEEAAAAERERRSG